MNIEENVVKIPDPLERRAQKIEAALTRRARGDGEWIEGTIELAIELTGARGDFRDNDRAFGRWLDQRFGDRAPARTNRAILIKWGADPNQIRAILEKSESRSIQIIDRMFSHARKHPQVVGAPRGHGRPRRVNKVEAVAEALKTETGQWPSTKKLAEVAGVGPRNADNALRAVKAVEDAIGRAPDITYTKAQDHHVEARIRAATKELEKAAQAREASFWERVTKEANASCAKRFPHLQERENDVVRAERHWRTVANNHKPIFTDAEYRDLLLCTHEANPSEETRKRAFMALKAAKLQLTGKK